MKEKFNEKLFFFLVFFEVLFHFDSFRMSFKLNCVLLSICLPKVPKLDQIFIRLPALRLILLWQIFSNAFKSKMKKRFFFHEFYFIRDIPELIRYVGFWLCVSNLIFQLLCDPNNSNEFSHFSVRFLLFFC